jgi:hypothetical protein
MRPSGRAIFAAANFVIYDRREKPILRLVLPPAVSAVEFSQGKAPFTQT